MPRAPCTAALTAFQRLSCKGAAACCALRVSPTGLQGKSVAAACLPTPTHLYMHAQTRTHMYSHANTRSCMRLPVTSDCACCLLQLLRSASKQCRAIPSTLVKDAGRTLQTTPLSSAHLCPALLCAACRSAPRQRTKRQGACMLQVRACACTQYTQCSGCT